MTEGLENVNRASRCIPRSCAERACQSAAATASFRPAIAAD